MAEDFSKLKIALVSDDLTRGGLQYECRVKNLTPSNYKLILKYWKPDLLLVESCWMGYKNKWKHKIASYPKEPDKNNRQLVRLVHYTKDLGIPTVFWNKEDDVHFERFIDSAKHFDHIFTTDSNMIPKYREFCKNTKTVNSLTFVINPKIHYPQNINKIKKFSFVGSYRTNLHENRRANQSMLLEPALEYGLDIYDRNSDRKSKIFRFPDQYSKCVKNRVPYHKTGDVYNKYLACLNVNTITDSPTMFSRRVVEVMACKTPLITTNSLAMETLFKDYVFIADNKEQASEYMKNLSAGIDKRTQEKLDAGYELIMREYTYNHWINTIISSISLSK